MQNKFYELQEVANRPYFLRVTLYTKVGSEQEARHLIKQLNSLRNTLMYEDRAEQVVGSLNMLRSKQTEVQK